MHMAAAEALIASHLITGTVTDSSSGLPLNVCRYNEAPDHRTAADVGQSRGFFSFSFLAGIMREMRLTRPDCKTAFDLYGEISRRRDRKSIRLFSVEAPEKLRLHCQ